MLLSANGAYLTILSPCRSIIILTTLNIHFPPYLLTDKTIKLWKISARSKYEANAVSSYENDGVIRFPTRARTSSENINATNGASRKGESKASTDAEASQETGATPLHASTKKVYSNAHAYHINSLATNSDGQTFVSSDDLRINWWNMEVSDTCFSKFECLCAFCVCDTVAVTIGHVVLTHADLYSRVPLPPPILLCTDVVDIKPDNMEELTEVITSVQFHPFNCALLTFSSSRGAIKVSLSGLFLLCFVEVDCASRSSGVIIFSLHSTHTFC